MTFQKSRWLAVVMAALGTAGAAQADEVRPLSDARPMADEKCLEQCDTQSDECMQSAEGDSSKLQVCDDKYSECLQACEAGG